MRSDRTNCLAWSITGRYFPGNTSGQDALSNIGEPGTFTSFSFTPLPTQGAIVAYRRFRTTQFSSNFSYAYSYEDYPSYALQFTPDSASALALNTDMQQVFANLIWSPFATIRDGVFGSGWLDVGSNMSSPGATCSVDRRKRVPPGPASESPIGSWRPQSEGSEGACAV